MCVSGLVFAIYYMVLVEACEREKCYDYVEIMEKLYGQFGRRLTEISISLLCFGAVAAYMVLVCSMLSSVLFSLGVVADPDDEQLRPLIIFGLTALVWLPMSIPSEISALQYFSMICVLAIIYITCVVVVSTPVYVLNNTSWTDLTLFNMDSSFLGAFGICFFAFDAVQNVPLIYNGLRPRNIRRMKKVVSRSILLLLCLYLALGVFGYLSYAGNVPDLVVFRPLVQGSSGQDWPMLIGRVMVCVYLSGAAPLNFYPLRKSVEQFISGSEYTPNRIRYLLITVTLLTLAASLAIAVPTAVSYFKVIGGILCSEMGFLVPSMIGWKTIDSTWTKTSLVILAVALTAIGVACAVDEIIHLS